MRTTANRSSPEFMNATEENIGKIETFLYDTYLLDISEQIRKGKDFVVIDYSLLARHDTSIATQLLDYPEDTLKEFEIAVGRLSAGDRAPVHFRTRFKNLPKSEVVAIRDIRVKHINKFITIEGTIRQKTDVRPKTKASRFECPSCGAVIPLLQLTDKFKEPTHCGCGRKGKFRILSTEEEDVQWIKIEESLETITGDRAKSLKILLEADLTSPLSEKKTCPGNKIRVNGMLKRIPVELRDGSTSTQSDFILEVNYIEPIEELFEELNITDQDIEQIKEVAKHSPLNFMLEALLPNVYGYSVIKKALVLQLFGGVKKERNKDSNLRGDIHILLLGNPGTAKSAMLKRMCELYPKARFTVAASSTGAGLVGAVVRSELTKEWTLEAGPLVLANKGLCAIDELDKSNDENRNKLHEAMEQQTCTVAKANIHETLPAETTVLAAANPKDGRFDLYKNELEQIDLPPTLRDRFDLILVTKELVNRDELRKKTKFILDRHTAAIEVVVAVKRKNPFDDLKFFQKYVAYAKINIRPILTSAAKKFIEDYYMSVLEAEDAQTNSPFSGYPKSGRFSPTAISTRQLEALIRLSEAHAKLRLSKTVEQVDTEFAIKLYEDCIRQVALDEMTGKIDVDIISTGISASHKDRLYTLKDVVHVTVDANEKKPVPIEEVMRLMKERGFTDCSKVEEDIDHLKRNGDLIEPRSGFVTYL